MTPTDSINQTSFTNSLDELTTQMIQLVAIVIEGNITTSLDRHSTMMQQKVPPPPTPNWEERMDSALNQLVTTRLEVPLGARKDIAVDIGPILMEIVDNATASIPDFVTAEKNQLLARFAPPTRSAIPSKLILMQSFERAIREPTPLFRAEFIKTVSRAIATEINSVPARTETFARHVRLHKLRHGLPAGSTACVWRLAEEDFLWKPYEREGGRRVLGMVIARFALKCGHYSCGRPHHIVIWNSTERADPTMAEWRNWVVERD